MLEKEMGEGRIDSHDQYSFLGKAFIMGSGSFRTWGIINGVLTAVGLFFGFGGVFGARDRGEMIGWAILGGFSLLTSAVLFSMVYCCKTNQSPRTEKDS
jgi:hypothetical protein